MKHAAKLVLLTLLCCSTAWANDKLINLMDQGLGMKTADFKREVTKRLADEVLSYDARDKQWELKLDDHYYVLRFNAEKNQIVGISLRGARLPEASYEDGMATSWALVRDLYQEMRSRRQAAETLPESGNDFPKFEELNKVDTCDNCSGLATRRLTFESGREMGRLCVWHYRSPGRYVLPVFSIHTDNMRNDAYPSLRGTDY